MAPRTETHLRNALQDVRNGAFVQGTAKKYGIPRRTLRNHLNSGSTVKRVGRAAILSTEREKELW